VVANGGENNEEIKSHEPTRDGPELNPRRRERECEQDGGTSKNDGNDGHCCQSVEKWNALRQVRDPFRPIVNVS
jgi:hypothetical protein